MRFFPISSATNYGVEKLLDALISKLANLAPVKKFSVSEDIDFEQIRKLKEKDFEILRSGKCLEIKSLWLSKIVSMLDFKDNESLAYLRKTLEFFGINSALKKAGATPGCDIKLGDFVFEFSE